MHCAGLSNTRAMLHWLTRECGCAQGRCILDEQQRILQRGIAILLDRCGRDLQSGIACPLWKRICIESCGFVGRHRPARGHRRLLHVLASFRPCTKGPHYDAIHHGISRVDQSAIRYCAVLAILLRRQTSRAGRRRHWRPAKIKDKYTGSWRQKQKDGPPVDETRRGNPQL